LDADGAPDGSRDFTNNEGKGPHGEVNCIMVNGAIFHFIPAAKIALRRVFS
jgi:hypothetical protein